MEERYVVVDGLCPKRCHVGCRHISPDTVKIPRGLFIDASQMKAVAAEKDATTCHRRAKAEADLSLFPVCAPPPLPRSENELMLSWSNW